MRAATIQLQNEDESHCRWITPGEATRMERLGQIRRVTPRKSAQVKYRMNPRVDASESKESPCEVTPSDVRVLVGFQKCSEGRLERLIGHRLLPPTAWVTERGMIRV